MFTRSLSDQIYKLTLVPVLTIALALGASLTYLHIQHINITKAKYVQTLLTQMAALLAPALETEDTDALQHATQAIMDNGVLTNVNIYNRNQQIVFHRGTRTLVEPEFTESRDLIDGSNTQYLFYPIVGTATKTPIGWIYGEIDNTFFDLLKYQTHALVLLVALLACLVAASLSTIFSRRILSPINLLNRGIESIGEGVYDKKIVIGGDNEFSQLANSLNIMASKIAADQQELQNNIDQSFTDIQETLETIEIQNVELDIARKKALEASRVKSEFLANTSHEIRTPLNGIIGFTNLMFKTELDNQQLEYLRTIENSSQNLLAIINDILDFSRIESGKLSLNLVQFKLRQVVEETLQILAPLAHEKSLNLLYFMDPTTPTQLLGDPLRFRQILTNLVSNAIKFSHSGNVIIDISAEKIEENKAHIKTSVIDRGIGINPDKANTLFQAFSQIDGSNTRKQSGTGLGLAISKGLVEKMGGQIGLETEQDKGSTFWFTATLGIDQQAATIAYNALQNITIVVVEENKEAYQQLKQMLTSWQVNTVRIAQLNKLEKNLDKMHERDGDLPLIIYSTNPLHLHQHQAEKTITYLQTIRAQYHCEMICLCHPNEQRRLQAFANHNGILFLNKPIMLDRLYRNICEKLNLESQLSYEHSRLTTPSNLRASPRINVLAVDDNRANLLLASEFLTNLGANVTPASNGIEAIAAAEKQVFDLIFMDVQMPDMDGLEATKRIRALEKNGARTPIVALTAHALDEQKAPLLLAGMDDFLSKPVSQEQLEHIIQRWCKSYVTKPLIQQTRPKAVSPAPKTEPTDTTNNTTNNALRGPVDIATSLKLSNYKPDLAKDMLSMLIEAIPSERQTIAQAYHDRNYSVLAEHVHKLHGGCCYVGVPTLKEISALLDDALEKNQWQSVDENIGSLLTAMDQLERWGDEHDIATIFSHER